MKGPRVVAIAHKKPDAEILRKRKAESKTTKERANKKKDSKAPKRPPSAFFIFMEDFRKSFKENHPDKTPVSSVGKAGSQKWKSMSDADKAPYVEKAKNRKADYVRAIEAHKEKLNGAGADEKPEDSGKSTSEIHDEAGQESSS
ncbi:high mobility group B protein 3-like [Mangifera indica]|uniref:high mobility group B protein 3-like n=1 Tax=Mangifera indica TaxID=29780 RepID=UPI001CFA25E3|nr:high mobility group B protein 3-like [Mangifera indica]XP_044502872.1 high mobility group B protein 3-like [Mangifera indica]